jgi:hypothetical protein
MYNLFENIRGLNLAMGKLVTVQVTQLPLQHSIRKKIMICFAKSVLAEVFCIVQNKEFSVTCYIRDTYMLDERPSIFKRGKPIFSSERTLHKDYDHKG